MLDAAFTLAAEISSKSPVAVQSTKINLIYSRDHSVTESLNYMVRLSIQPITPSLIPRVTNQGPAALYRPCPLIGSLLSPSHFFIGPMKIFLYPFYYRLPSLSRNPGT